MKQPRTPFLSLGLAALYYVSAELGLRLAFIHPSATSVWPPSGIALAACLLLGYRVWPGVFLGALLANLQNGSAAAAIAAGNTLEALCGAWLVNRFAGGRGAFDCPRDVFRFLLLAAFSSTTISATFGAGALALHGLARAEELGRIWLTWWLGDAAGVLIVAPLLILWGGGCRMRWRSDRAVEASFLLAAFILVSRTVFGPSPLPHPFESALAYLHVPVVVWSAFRFGRRVTATVVFLIAVVATWATLRGLGPFAAQTPDRSLMLLQTFIGINGMTAIALATLVWRQQTTEESLMAMQARSEERFHLLVEAVKDYAIFMVDPRGVVLTWNVGAERISGYSADEIIGRHFSLFYLPEDVRLGRPERCLQDAERLGRTAEEGWRVRKDGSRFMAEIMTAPVRDSRQDLVGFARVIRDLTEQKQAEEAADLRKRDAVRNEFVAMLSHEFRTPIAAIKGFAETLMDGGLEDSKNRRRFVRIIEKHVNHLSLLVEDLLDLSAIKYGRRLRLETVALDSFLPQVLKSVEPLAKKKALSIQTRVQEGLTASADKAQLVQVLQNLYSNAVEHSRAGGRVEVDAIGRDGQAVVSVRDFGVGIAPADLPRIFEHFYRARAGRYQRRGTGLGLCIVSSIVQAHGGSVWVESEEGSGSVFYFTLPCPASEALEASTA